LALALSFLAALGVGSIVAAWIGHRVSISNHRQAWINGLRDDIAQFMKELEAMHYAIDDLWGKAAGGEFEKRRREVRVAILFVYWRIVLRLNRAEQMHIDLKEKLDALLVVTERVPNREKVEATVDLARCILKREWNVTKLGPFGANWRMPTF
jgi:hypothetical protein